MTYTLRRTIIWQCPYNVGRRHGVIYALEHKIPRVTNYPQIIGQVTGRCKTVITAKKPVLRSITCEPKKGMDMVN